MIGLDLRRFAFATSLLAWVAFSRTSFAQQAEPPPQPPADDPEEQVLDRTPRLGGFLQVFYRFNVDTNNDDEHRPSAFRVQRARLKVEGDLTDRLSYDVEVDPRAPGIGGVLRDCFLTLRLLGGQKLRIGQQKTQFGYENNESSTRLFTVNRTEVSDSLSRGITLRDQGLGLLGRVRLGGGFRLENAVTVVNGAGMNAQEDDDSRKSVWGRLGVRYKFGGNKIWLGGSYGNGSVFEAGDLDLDPADDYFFDLESVGADVEFDNRWVFAAAELVKGREEVTRAGPAGPTVGEASTGTGYYALLVFKTPWRFGPLARYDVLDEDWERLTVGAFYGLPDEVLRVLVNSELRREEGKASDVRSYVWLQGSF